MFLVLEWNYLGMEAQVVLSVRFEEAVSLSLTPAGADNRGLEAPIPLVENAGIQPMIRKRVPPPELRLELGLTESTVRWENIINNKLLPFTFEKISCISLVASYTI